MDWDIQKKGLLEFWNNETREIYIYIYIYIYMYIYMSIPLTIGLIARNGGLSTLCHSYGFACQQRVLKTFPGPGYLRSEDGVV